MQLLQSSGMSNAEKNSVDPSFQLPMDIKQYFY